MTRKIFTTVLFSVLLSLFSACGGISDPDISPNLFGVWEYANWEDGATTMRRVTALPNDNSGFIIYDDGKFVERKNSGWCGTPPIAYKNYEGDWSKETEQELKVSVGYWGGTEIYSMKIISLDFNELKYEKIYPPILYD